MVQRNFVYETLLNATVPESIFRRASIVLSSLGFIDLQCIKNIKGSVHLLTTCQKITENNK
jgi:hypothetical protein